MCELVLLGVCGWIDFSACSRLWPGSITCSFSRSMFCCMLVGRGCVDRRREELRTGVCVGLGRTGREVRTASEGGAHRRGCIRYKAGN